MNGIVVRMMDSWSTNLEDVLKQNIALSSTDLGKSLTACVPLSLSSTSRRCKKTFFIQVMVFMLIVFSMFVLKKQCQKQSTKMQTSSNSVNWTFLFRGFLPLLVDIKMWAYVLQLDKRCDSSVHRYCGLTVNFGSLFIQHTNVLKIFLHLFNVFILFLYERLLHYGISWYHQKMGGLRWYASSCTSHDIRSEKYLDTRNFSYFCIIAHSLFTLGLLHIF